VIITILIVIYLFTEFSIGSGVATIPLCMAHHT